MIKPRVKEEKRDDPFSELLAKLGREVYDKRVQTKFFQSRLGYRQ